MKCQNLFSWKNVKRIINVSTAQLAQKKVKVNTTDPFFFFCYKIKISGNDTMTNPHRNHKRFFLRNERRLIGFIRYEIQINAERPSLLVRNV